ncbi:MAG: D-alanyl-D-alanine carboxypeptidase [Desulfobacterales bacterium]|nr:D-alanyl-D-alanine carboxypeptidase [Desulfobacterales bacterium]
MGRLWQIQLAVGLIIAGLLAAAPARAGNPTATSGLGPRDALLVTAPNGRVVIAHNPDRELVPASTLKVLTALAARHYLGADFRFRTDFHLDPQNRLIIRGFGDPLLVSEVLADIARTLKRHLKAPITAILLDDRYFSQPLAVPGVSTSTNPYDAPLGALRVNFNTVNFKTRRGRIVSAEQQTPLLPMVMQRIRASGLARGRIVLSHHGHEGLRYAGELFRHFLLEAGIRVEGPVSLVSRTDPSAPLIYRHVSPFSLDELVARLMEFSNNFIANQLLIAIGAHVYGAPGNLAKGARALNAYASEVLGITTARFVEGSGISRANHISARALMRALAHFEPHRRLMTHKAGTYFKTGTLKGIRTRVGYIENRDGRPHRFVLLLNTPGKRPEPILKKVQTVLQPP